MNKATKKPKHFISDMYQSLFTTEIKSLFWLLIGVILVGTVFYVIVEGWSWLDSYYFSVMTLTTVGYGDLAPATSLGKIFTSIYVLFSIGIVFAFVKTLARHQAKDSVFGRIFNRNNNEDKK